MSWKILNCPVELRKTTKLGYYPLLVCYYKSLCPFLDIYPMKFCEYISHTVLLYHHQSVFHASQHHSCGIGLLLNSKVQKNMCGVMEIDRSKGKYNISKRFKCMLSSTVCVLLKDTSKSCETSFSWCVRCTLSSWLAFIRPVLDCTQHSCFFNIL